MADGVRRLGGYAGCLCRCSKVVDNIGWVHLALG